MTLPRVLRRQSGAFFRPKPVAAATASPARAGRMAIAVAAGFCLAAAALARPAAADVPPHVEVTARPLALLLADVMKGVGAPRMVDAVQLAKLTPEAMRTALGDTRLVVWIGPFHQPRMAPVLKGQTAISGLALFDVRGVRLMGLPEPAKPGVKPADKSDLPNKSPVAARRREISARDLYHKYPDPYIWLDPRNGIAMVRAITVRLSAIDPGRGRLYRRNGAALISQIEAFDQELQVRVVPMRRIKFVALDRTFQYFERQYNLQPTIRLDDSNRPMSPAEATQARRKLAGSRLDCVIVPTTSARGAQIVRGLKVRVAWIDPYGRDKSVRDKKAKTYVAFLRSVANRYTTCLTGRRPPNP